jgi:hypothetical protein
MTKNKPKHPASVRLYLKKKQARYRAKKAKLTAEAPSAKRNAPAVDSIPQHALLKDKAGANEP